MHRTLRALLGVTLLVPAAAVAQTDDVRINAAFERFTPQITELRHRIHQNPELGNREVKTAALVAQHLPGQ